MKGKAGDIILICSKMALFFVQMSRASVVSSKCIKLLS